MKKKHIFSCPLFYWYSVWDIFLSDVCLLYKTHEVNKKKDLPEGEQSLQHLKKALPLTLYNPHNAVAEIETSTTLKSFRNTNTQYTTKFRFRKLSAVIVTLLTMWHHLITLNPVERSQSRTQTAESWVFMYSWALMRKWMRPAECYDRLFKKKMCIHVSLQQFSYFGVNHSFACKTRLTAYIASGNRAPSLVFFTCCSNHQWRSSIMNWVWLKKGGGIGDDVWSVLNSSCTEAQYPLHTDRQPHWSSFTHEEACCSVIIHHVMYRYRAWPL